MNRSQLFLFFIAVINICNANIYAQLFGGQIKIGKNWSTLYPQGSVFCTSGPTVVNDVINPTTGKTWMDRNLGAYQVATSPTDTNSYGDLYQWGRGSDGHQCRNSLETTFLSSADQPGHGNFIKTTSSPNDWRSPQNMNLWQGADGINNPCPFGYRLPSASELAIERISWNTNDMNGAFGSNLKFPLAGNRTTGNTNPSYVQFPGVMGYYWSSTVGDSTWSKVLSIGWTTAIDASGARSNGLSVRCIKAISNSNSGSILNLNCELATVAGSIIEGIETSGVSFSVPYTGGNGGTYNTEIIFSMGVTGLVATIAAGTFLNGSGTLTLSISGIPSGSGNAIFHLNIGGQSCYLTINVLPETSPFYPSNSIFCESGPTTVVDVTNPVTGKTWMDRNLGAKRAAISSTDYQAYGDLYQWGRSADGHQCRNSTTSSTLSSLDQPGNGYFIITFSSPKDWRSPQNANLWQETNGANNPCPIGYRLPSIDEFYNEISSFSMDNSFGAFESPLKLPFTGFRDESSGSVGLGSYGFYWTNSIDVNSSFNVQIYINTINPFSSSRRAMGMAVRCIKN